jgi:hypothetical protein
MNRSWQIWNLEARKPRYEIESGKQELRKRVEALLRFSKLKKQRNNQLTRRILGIELTREIFVGGKRIWKPESHDELLKQESRKKNPDVGKICGRSIFVRGRLHELDCCPIGIANVDNALPGIWARLEDLRLADRAPTGRCNRAQHSVKIIYRQRHMDRSDIARSEIGTLSVRWGVVLEQLNPVPGSLENGDRDLSTGHSGDFTGEVTCMMRPMRKFEAEDILPEGQRPLDVRDRETGVIRGNDVKRGGTHTPDSV